MLEGLESPKSSLVFSGNGVSKITGGEETLMAVLLMLIVFVTTVGFSGCGDSHGADIHEQAAKRVFREQCAACHALGGQGSHSSVAMDHEGASRTQAWLEVQIRHPEKHNPNTAMPLFPPDRITESDLHDLAHYLASLK